MNQRLLFCLLFFVLLGFAGGWMSPDRAQAQQQGEAADDRQERGPWSYDAAAGHVEKSIARQKSEMRAQQRMARLAAMRWYGFSGGRPTVAGVPFTSTYSYAWRRSERRPFAWFASTRPIIVIQRPQVESAYR